MTTPFLAVVNPAAGGGKCGKLVGPVLERLRSVGVKFDIVETGFPGQGIELVREAYEKGYRRFIAVGGDGTSYEIVNGLFPRALGDRPPTLAFLPLGTGNSFLRDFTDRGLEHATEALIAGRSRPCDVVRLRHKEGVIHYINILSLGFVADVCRLTNRRFKWLGKMGYGLAVVLCLARFKRTVFPIRVDGAAEMDRSRTALLIFNNSKFTAGSMMLAPQADTNDGLVEIVRWSVGRSGFIFNFPNVYDGSHINHSAIWHRGAKRVDFELDGPIDLMVDGEVLRLHCQTLEVLPAALKVMV